MIAAGGAALARIEETEEEATSKAMLRSAGQVVSVAAIGGIIHEAGNEVQEKIDTPIVPIVTGLAGFGYMASRWAKELETRIGLIDRKSAG